jgi:predicted DNA-binding transcriptional regulator AlpA
MEKTMPALASGTLEILIDDESFTPQELAPKLKMTVPHLANMRSKGTGPRFIKLGSGRQSPVRYPRAWVLEWLMEHNAEAQI